ncbi:MAG TPA: hypothetical protein ENG83_06280 [Nitrospirae bacterium]|nr:hypothetical protein [Nitrospirota bacterium]HDL20809.1 hypothetical protein [Nitrospirota bacterium]HDZ01473.1 hypothetical protein [Nitrospirota bacterium]
MRKSATHLSGGLTKEREGIQLREAFNRVLRINAAIVASLFICAAIVEWARSAYVPFNGFVDYEWLPRLRTFLYLMAMFNLLLIRYVVMRIYIAPGPPGFGTIVKRLSKAGIASMLASGLPCFYGLLLFLSAGDPVDFYLLFGLSVIYGMIYFPRYKSWVSLAEENAGRQ